MTWRLVSYPDRTALADWSLVGDFEDKEGLFAVITRLKKSNWRCLPIVVHAKDKSEVLYAVRLGIEYDALFWSVELAHEWVQRRMVMMIDSEERDQTFQVTAIRLDDIPAWIEKIAPPPWWERLRASPYA